jgi:pyruvate/2-oxoglutarate dehydrogenase complex dihydrolipoamide dehydrogenase (E3) component
MHDADKYGAPRPQEPPIDYAEVLRRVRAIRARISEYHSARRIALRGVDLFFGAASFDNSNALRVGDAQIKFEKALIATGARPRPSNIPGLEQVGYLTSDTIFDLKTLPGRIAVIGGGPLGCELAQALRRLGPHVTIIQADPKFLPREERDAAEILSRSMARGGVEIRLNTTVTAARFEGGAKVLETINNGMRSDLQSDEIILSIGRVPNVEDLRLSNAGITTEAPHGIAVDDFLCSANSNIYAAGDVCLDLKFTNAAQSSALLAVQNALLGTKKGYGGLIIPWCTYCDPEIAHVGLYVAEAHRRGIPVRTYTVLMKDVDRAITDGKDGGFVKIHVEQNTDKILGATIMASHASELINEMAVIMSAEIGMRALAKMVHAYPTQSQAIMSAACAFVDDEKLAADELGST